MLKSQRNEDDAIIIEFKIHNPKNEKDLQATVNAALKQIEDMEYQVALIEEGIEENRIWKYGFAFDEKKVLIG